MSIYRILPDGKFRGNLTIYGFAVEKGTVTLRESSESEATEVVPIKGNGEFLLTATEDLKDPKVDFQLLKPCKLNVTDQSLQCKTDLYPVISWDEVKNEFLAGNGNQLVNRAKELRQALEIVGYYRKDTEKNMGNRFFLESANAIVPSGDPKSEHTHFELQMDCYVETIPDQALAGPLRIRGMPTYYADLTNSKKLHLEHCIIVNPRNRRPYGN